MKTAGAQAGPFGLGAQIFGSASPSPASSPQDTREDDVIGEDDDAISEDSEDEDDEAEAEDEQEQEDEEDIIAERLAGVALEPSPWSSAPSYAPLYLSTVSEYVPPAPKLKLPPGAASPDDENEREGGGRKAQARKDREEKAGAGAGDAWGLEGYENSIEVDHAFERFSRRVGYEPEQCLR